MKRNRISKFFILFSLILILGLVSCGQTSVPSGETGSETEAASRPAGTETEFHTESDKTQESRTETAPETGEPVTQETETEVETVDLIGPILVSATGFKAEVVDGNTILTMTVNAGDEYIDLSRSFGVLPGCSWELYEDFVGTKKYALKAMNLVSGENVAYVIVWNADKSDFRRYELRITRPVLLSYQFVNGTEVLYSGTVDSETYVKTVYEPAQTGMTFAGWTVNGEIVTLPVKISRDTVFVARFTPNTYTITLNADGGQVRPATLDVVYGEEYNLPEPTWANHKFLGWSGADGQFALTGTYQIAHNTTLKAQWKELRTAGENIEWNYNADTETLSLTGTGEMTNYADLTSRPWHEIAGDIEKITVSGGITSIGNSAFADCVKLDGVQLPDTVTSIGSLAFARCSALQSIQFGGGLKSIGVKAFLKCYALNGVSLPAGMTVLGESAFEDCGLTAFHSGNLNSIGINAFARCTALTEVTLGDALEVLSEKAFMECSALERVTVGKGLKMIGTDAFNLCEKLAELNWNAVSAQDATAQNKPFSNAGKTAQNGLRMNIGPEVKRIPGYLFYGGKAYVTSVHFAENGVCEEIGKYAFGNCSGLTELTLPASLRYIRDKAFYNCASLTEIRLNAADLSEMQLVNLSLPFGGTGDRNDELVLIVGNQVTTIPNYLFYGSDITEVRFEAESVCQTIGAFAFGQCRVLSLVSLPASLTEIGEECFAGDGIENCSYSGTTGQIQTIWSGVQPTDFVITCSDGIWPEQDEG